MSFRSNEESLWLKQSIEDAYEVFGAGHLGLYEIMWALNGREDASSAEKLRVATKALRIMLDERAGDIRRCVWPNEPEGDALDPSVIDPAWFDDPSEESGEYVALDPSFSSDRTGGLAALSTLKGQSITRVVDGDDPVLHVGDACSIQATRTIWIDDVLRVTRPFDLSELMGSTIDDVHYGRYDNAGIQLQVGPHVVELGGWDFGIVATVQFPDRYVRTFNGGRVFVDHGNAPFPRGKP